MGDPFSIDDGLAAWHIPPAAAPPLSADGGGHRRRLSSPAVTTGGLQQNSPRPVPALRFDAAVARARADSLGSVLLEDLGVDGTGGATTFVDHPGGGVGFGARVVDFDSCHAAAPALPAFSGGPLPLDGAWRSARVTAPDAHAPRARVGPDASAAAPAPLSATVGVAGSNRVADDRAGEAPVPAPFLLLSERLWDSSEHTDSDGLSRSDELLELWAADGSQPSESEHGDA